MTDFDAALERLLTDDGFKAALAADPARALAGYRLTPDEVELLSAQVSTDAISEAKPLSLVETAPGSGKFVGAAFFRRVFDGCRDGLRFYNNPLYLDFLMGKREYECSQWSTPTYTPAGWRKPCYGWPVTHSVRKRRERRKEERRCTS